MRQPIVSTLGGLGSIQVHVSRLLLSLVLGISQAGCSASSVQYPENALRARYIDYGDLDNGTAAIEVPASARLTFPKAERSLRWPREAHWAQYPQSQYPSVGGPNVVIVEAGTHRIDIEFHGESRVEVWRAQFDKTFQFEAGLAYRLRMMERRDVVEFEIEPFPLAKFSRRHPNLPGPLKAGPSRPRNVSPPNQQ